MLTRWDPFAEMARLQDQMLRFTRGNEKTTRGGFVPAVDIYEEKDAILVKAELPGTKAQDVHVSVENDVLTIKGERKLEREDKAEGYHSIEREYGEFTRSFALPKTVDGGQISADLTDGVLTVRVPKRAAPEPKRIDVKTGGGTKPVTPGQA